LATDPEIPHQKKEGEIAVPAKKDTMCHVVERSNIGGPTFKNGGGGVGFKGKIDAIILFNATSLGNRTSKLT